MAIVYLEVKIAGSSVKRMEIILKVSIIMKKLKKNKCNAKLFGMLEKMTGKRMKTEEKHNANQV